MQIIKILQMKKITNIIIGAVIFLFPDSCSDFEFESYGAPTYENYWKSEDDVLAAA